MSNHPPNYNNCNEIKYFNVPEAPAPVAHPNHLHYVYHHAYPGYYVHHYPLNYGNQMMVQQPQPTASYPAAVSQTTYFIYPPYPAMYSSPNSQCPFEWVSMNPQDAHNYIDRAVVAGAESNDGPLWVIRAHYKNNLLPGKFSFKQLVAFVGLEGKEIPVINIEVLCARPNSVRWLPARNGSVPVNAVNGGNSDTGEALYVGRAVHRNFLTPGKVYPSHGFMYVTSGGHEHSFRNYEVLCATM